MRLTWSARSRADLRKIDSWLSLEADRVRAERVLRAIVDRSSRLIEFPLIGPAVGDSPHVRSISVATTPYLLIDRLTDTITVLRVHHAREDWRSA